MLKCLLSVKSERVKTYASSRNNIKWKCDYSKNCTIFHQVTIGNNEHKNTERTAAHIGDNAYIGCGAKIIGAIKIGNNVRIGANAVVVTDIDDNCTIYSKQLIKYRSNEICD